MLLHILYSEETCIFVKYLMNNQNKCSLTVQTPAKDTLLTSKLVADAVFHDLIKRKCVPIKITI